MQKTYLVKLWQRFIINHDALMEATAEEPEKQKHRETRDEFEAQVLDTSAFLNSRITEIKK